MTGTSIQPSINNVRGLPQALANKVDKEAGKGLFSGSYEDLNNKPTINGQTLTGNITISGTGGGSVDLSSYYTKSEVNTIVSGKSDTTHNHSLNNLAEKSYNSLTDKPTIPTQYTDQMARDAVSVVGYLTSSSLSSYYTKTQVDNIASIHNYADAPSIASNMYFLVEDPDHAYAKYKLPLYTVWNENPPVVTGDNATFLYGYYTLSADQTTNLAVGNHIQFDTVVGSLPAPSNGTGQQKGIISLPAGKYKIHFREKIGASGSNSLTTSSVVTYDRTNSQNLGQATHCVPVTSTVIQNSLDSFVTIINLSTTTDIELRILSSSLWTALYANYSYLYIEEYNGV